MQEVWFRGVHSDGGGGQSVGLSSIAHCWMLANAKLNGLPIDSAKFASFSAQRDGDAKISKNFDPKADAKRTVGERDLVHQSVKPRGTANGTAHNDPPASCVVAQD